MVEDILVKSIITNLINRYSDNIIAIYGIGSYFDDSLPPNWEKNDLDMVVFVKSLDKIPKQDWTEVRFEKKEINSNQVWLGYNTIEGYQNRYTFSKESFSNYEWSLIELKNPENSKLLYGNDIRNQLPSTYKVNFDYDDILARSLYHLNKSLGEENTSTAKHEFSKAVFKAAFYCCIFIDSSYRSTSIVDIGGKIKYQIRNYDFLKEMHEFLEETIIFRITGQFKTEFNTLQTNFVTYIFSLLDNGRLHKKVNYHKVMNYLTDSFRGFPYLIQEIRKLDIFKKKEIKIADLTYGIKNLSIIGTIKEIFGTYRFDKEDATKGKVGSFLLSDSTGHIRVVLWDDQVKYFRKNDFNVGRSVYIVNGYTKQGKNGLGIEIHLSTFGSIYFLPEDKKMKKAKMITKREVAKRLDFVKNTKSIRIPCPYCGFLCPPNIRKCRKCGEPLPK